mmetsp:Transcript_14234/g.23260  ORF Transcript_14234/g.23260 Transcript_14234/m.23260 type:complete len:332 (+) Transcript_14234:976-1971(+)|eukprot:CAMPEP_0203743740 /NCGR_PEP_ID=MMETSP0098-20131031/52_1 /ASSEMBLY_ACC=CAM_ASM_000208 /TAXON_ID=96639 /ORGANISM=" , Strain NY0313808BC1" /LENGTH=331 /DNA_ID=CAMNT_0050631067 /DNA_START=765 /DNA_END=1760 /DNA_ORIENTATION=-
MSLVNLGGPGWISDVFSLDIIVNQERTISCHSLLFQEKCPLVSSLETFTGYLKIVPPEGCTVRHNGIGLQFEWSLSFFETLSTTEHTVVELNLAEPGYIGEETLIPFEIDMAELASKYVETYDGEMFCVRHSLLAKVARPWWTFDVISSLSLAVHKINAAPLVEDHIVDDDTVPGSPAVCEHRLRVKDVNQGLYMKYERSCLNIGETFKGVAYLGSSEGVDDAMRINRLQVAIYKIESGEGDSNEAVLHVQDIDLTKRDFIDGVDSTTLCYKVEIPITKGEANVEYTPTLVDPSLSVRYYVRLVATDTSSDESHWQTHELVLYRATLAEVI